MTKSTPKPRRYRGASGDQRRAERRQQLLDAGLSTIGEVGYQACSVRSICAAAGLTERYFYESFANKEALLAEVYQAQTNYLKKTMLAAFNHAERNSQAFAQAGLHAFFDTLHQNPAVARLLLFEILGVSDTIDRLYYEAMEEFAVLIRSLASSLGLADIVEMPDQDIIYAGLVGAVIQIARRWALTGYKDSVNAVISSSLFLFVATANYTEQTKNR